MNTEREIRRRWWRPCVRQWSGPWTDGAFAPSEDGFGLVYRGGYTKYIQKLIDFVGSFYKETSSQLCFIIEISRVSGCKQPENCVPLVVL